MSASFEELVENDGDLVDLDQKDKFFLLPPTSSRTPSPYILPHSPPLTHIPLPHYVAST